jgi:hypothetical protein
LSKKIQQNQKNKNYREIECALGIVGKSLDE